MDKYSYIANAHGDYIDEIYNSYKQNPESVDISWQRFFEGFEFQFSKDGENGAGKEVESLVSHKETSVRNLIYSYRSMAHLKSNTNPVRERRQHSTRLDPEHFALSSSDMDTEFEVGKEIGIGKAKFSKILDTLKKIYLGPIGFEYNHIRDSDRFEWCRDRVENPSTGALAMEPPLEEKKLILSKLNEAVVFENFLHTKFIGQKRFSLEGGENTIPVLDKIIRLAAEFNVEEVVIGMAHRGRLNVLANIMGKTYEQIFNEFEGNVDPTLTMGDGDVKYHLGYSSFIPTPSGRDVYVKLAPNPSHLEAVDPVVLGYTRAQIDDEYKEDASKAIPLILHGDAAIAGQGILYEIVQMSQLPGYTTGGTIHVVINNQVGFTTDYDDARSSIYCTDLAKIIDAPILHVNGDDAEAAIFAAQFAVEYRMKFQRDVFIDLLGYRRHGHNESDEPKFTQPKLYSFIAKHPNPREIYLKKLLDRGDVDAELANNMDKEFRAELQDRLNEVKQKPLPYIPQKIEEEWHVLRHSTPQDFDESPETGISPQAITKVAKALTTLPNGFKPLKQIEKIIKDRKINFFDRKILSWADGEQLAYGSLLIENKIVRMSGQDVQRGTFSHRHAYLFDANTNEPYCPLDHIQKDQRKLWIYNSLLSEFGVLGFEYGFAMATPMALVIWEAQFGDFVNGTQVIIDQFIASAETKWERMNGLVMLLPHGYEGQGPEHSSARPERFLQLCANNNMVVSNVTTPANLFHLLRRQVTWEFRIPCINFSPKSLLRHPSVVSPIEEFTHSKFQEVYADNYVTDKSVRRVLLCTGKIFYDLYEEQQKRKAKDVAILRLEQVHPFPRKQLDVHLKKYKKAELFWVQEEPNNMGCWTYILRTMEEYKELKLIARKASASPATGFAKLHREEQARIVQKSFD
ncbi:MAG: 2-oxoglutarate dehydrogenase E1 component [Bacteroidetes bacterium]|nr:2-oxoglutarate dehydrogenase E1 component [Bacteroidota bacterium]MDA1120707.1 2-oxoglutarate dehydrogenase E1 component [Bacteroidota bacterium]